MRGSSQSLERPRPTNQPPAVVPEGAIIQDPGRRSAIAQGVGVYHGRAFCFIFLIALRFLPLVVLSCRGRLFLCFFAVFLRLKAP
jgi:hypothetical protein